MDASGCTRAGNEVRAFVSARLPVRPSLRLDYKLIIFMRDVGLFLFIQAARERVYLQQLDLSGREWLAELCLRAARGESDCLQAKSRANVPSRPTKNTTRSVRSSELAPI